MSQRSPQRATCHVCSATQVDAARQDYAVPHACTLRQPVTARQVLLVVGLLVLTFGALDRSRTAMGQTAGDVRNVSVVIEGRVEQILAATSARIPMSVVQVLIEQATLRRTSKADAAARYPVPGEYVYIHVATPQNETGVGNEMQLPHNGQMIRAYILSADHGAWQSASAAWFEVIGSGPDEGSPTKSAKEDVTESPVSRAVPVKFAHWGMQGESVHVGSRVALRVMKVDADGPARRAGLEVGDVIVAINGQTLDLELLQRPLAEKLQLSVVDVNSGRVAQVEIGPQAAVSDNEESVEPPGTPNVTPDSDVSTPPPISLGISAEAVTIGVRSALKVTRVMPDSAAAKAGLEPGDVLVKVNGTAITRPEQLAAALRKTGPKLTLTVRDIRTGKDVDVEVELSQRTKNPRFAPAPEPPAISVPPSTSDPSGDPSNSRLGVVTELAFFDNEAAVVITEVEAGGPAAKAGLKVGTLITKANGMAVLHPNDLLDAERSAGQRIELRLVDSKSGRESSLVIALP